MVLHCQSETVGARSLSEDYQVLEEIFLPGRFEKERLSALDQVTQRPITDIGAACLLLYLPLLSFFLE